MNLVSKSLILGFAGIVITAATSAYAATNVVYVLDASNSMWGQIDGVAKIETARDIMGELLNDLTGSTSVGLLVYGHRSEDSCDDIEVLSGLGDVPPDVLISKLNEIQPKGKTPIAGALSSAKKLFTSNDARNNLVLISDGIETCNGDPCVVAKELGEGGINTKVHAVGFDVDADARKQLECIAENGGGKYFNATNAAELRVALAEVKEVVEVAPEITAPPEPELKPEPKEEQVFFDDFDQTQLSEDWVVNNANPENYIVEGSKLTVINNGVGGFMADQAENIFVLKRELPTGDWDAHFTFSGEIKTGRDSIWFGLYTDSKNFLGGQFYTAVEKGVSTTGCSHAALQNNKMSNGERTTFSRFVLGGSSGCGSGVNRPQLMAAMEEYVANGTATLTAHKRGRSYYFSMDLGQKTSDGSPIIYETDTLTSLRSPGDIAFAVGKYEKAQGEILVNVESVEIVAIN